MTERTPKPDAPRKPASRRTLSFMQTLRAVAWSFFGVRKSSEHEKDLSQVNPVHLIIAGVLGALLLIGLLITLVSWVIASGVAG